MEGRVQMQPAVAERLSLKAVRVRHRDHDDAAGPQEPGRLANRPAGIRKVFERVPEDDRGPLSLDPLERVVAHVLTPGVALQADRLSAAAAQRIDQDRFTGAHVEDRPGRRDPIEATRQAARGSGAGAGRR